MKQFVFRQKRKKLRLLVALFMVLGCCATFSACQSSLPTEKPLERNQSAETEAEMPQSASTNAKPAAEVSPSKSANTESPKMCDYTMLLGHSVKDAINTLGSNYTVTANALDQYTLLYQNQSAQAELLTDAAAYGELNPQDVPTSIIAIYMSGDVDVTGTGLMANTTLDAAKSWCNQYGFPFTVNENQDEWGSQVFMDIQINDPQFPLTISWYNGDAAASQVGMLTAAACTGYPGEEEYYDEYVEPYQEYAEPEPVVTNDGYYMFGDCIGYYSYRSSDGLYHLTGWWSWTRNVPVHDSHGRVWTYESDDTKPPRKDSGKEMLPDTFSPADNFKTVPAEALNGKWSDWKSYSNGSYLADSLIPSFN